MTISKGQLLRIKDLSAAVTDARVAQAICPEKSMAMGKMHADCVRFHEDQLNRYLRKLMKVKPVDDGIRFSFRTIHP